MFTIDFSNNGTTSRTAVNVMHVRNAVVAFYSFAEAGAQPKLGDINAIEALVASNLRAAS